MAFTPPATWITPRTWTRENSDIFISNEPALLSVESVKEAFESDFVYWTTSPIPEDALRQMLYGAMSFGVYKRIQPQSDDTPPSTKNTEQIGLARMTTDGASFAYLADVYVLPEYQGKGLGKWLVECIREVFSKENMPYLRRLMLFTGNERTQAFYTKLLNMKELGHEERSELGLDLKILCARPNA